MAHFAKLDGYNTVTYVCVVDNEYETYGEKWLNDNGFTGRWVQTSYNRNFRGKYAAIGDIYDEVNDIFTSPTQ